MSKRKVSVEDKIYAVIYIWMEKKVNAELHLCLMSA